MGAMGLVVILCGVVAAIAMLNKLDAKTRQTVLLVGAGLAVSLVVGLLTVRVGTEHVEETALSASDGAVSRSLPVVPRQVKQALPKRPLARADDPPGDSSWAPGRSGPEAPGDHSANGAPEQGADSRPWHRPGVGAPGPTREPMAGPTGGGRSMRRTVKDRMSRMLMMVPVILAIGAMVWLARSPGARKLVGLAAGVAMAAGVPIAAVWWLLAEGTHVETQRAERTSAAAPTDPPAGAPERRAAMESGAGWREPEQGAGFLADAYPSRELALEALLARANERWLAPLGVPRASADGNRPAVVLMVHGDALFERVTRTVRAIVDSPLAARVRVASARQSDGGSIDANASTPTLVLTETKGQESQGAFSLEVRSPAARAGRRMTVGYVDKPWAARFESWREGDRYRLGVSSATCATVDEARREAYASVVADVVDRVGDVIRAEQRAGRLPSQRHGLVASDSQIRSLLLRRGASPDVAVADRFLQAYERPYGTVYRQWLLVDLADENLREEARRIAGELSEQRTRRAYAWIMRVGLTGGVVLATVLCYLLLDGFTKGYYRWWVRGAAAVMFLAGLAIVMRISSGL
jgi:hypothetical protein